MRARVNNVPCLAEWRENVNHEFVEFEGKNVSADTQSKYCNELSKEVVRASILYSS